MATVDPPTRWRFTRRDIAIYVVLTAAQVVVYAWAISRWVDRGVGRGGAALLLIIPFVIGTMMIEIRWVTLPLMRVPVDREPRPGWRVGVATTFVPSSESIEMLEATVVALVAMRYPHDTWVLDEGDSPDVRELCARLGCRHYSRRSRPERLTSSGVFAARTKHGNYNSWLADEGYRAYDVIVNVDPDHIVEPNFLERTLGHLNDDSVGYVQAAQVYYNQGASLIARGAAEETYAYYSSIQMTSFFIGYPIVTGCHTVHRATALKAIGGFSAHDADDLLSTFYYRCAGWRGVYVPETLAVGLTPVDWPSYLSQQRRWATSVLDVKLRIYPRLAHSMPRTERVVSYIHGLYYLQGVTSALSLVALCGALAHGWRIGIGSSAIVGTVALIGVLLACDFFRQTFYLNRRRELGLHWRAALLRFAKWPWVLIAFVDAVRGRTRQYSITRKTRSAVRGKPKVAVTHSGVALAIAASVAVGALRGATQPAPLLVVAAIYVAFAIAVALTELLTPASPFDPVLAAERPRFDLVP
jgi:cellulose synthase/poly-beta-1,6-N-acetylglucosamine synthase-like glycosyltransferase